MKKNKSKTPIADTCDFIHELFVLSPLLLVAGVYGWREIAKLIETL
jgi:hypothetical protein